MLDWLVREAGMQLWELRAAEDSPGSKATTSFVSLTQEPHTYTRPTWRAASWICHSRHVFHSLSLIWPLGSHPQRSAILTVASSKPKIPSLPCCRSTACLLSKDQDHRHVMPLHVPTLARDIVPFLYEYYSSEGISWHFLAEVIATTTTTNHACPQQVILLISCV